MRFLKRGRETRDRRQVKPVWLLSLVLPVALLVPAYPTLSVWWFKKQEPVFLMPLKHPTLQIREDAYGEGHFGARRSGGRKHRGVDLAAPIGTQVLAAKSGRAFNGPLQNGMGHYVVIEHPDGTKTLYGHLEEVWIREEQRIRRGQAIGTVGKTGNARHRLIRPHVHFEVWNEAGEPVDPMAAMEPASDE